MEKPILALGRELLSNDIVSQTDLCLATGLPPRLCKRLEILRFVEVEREPLLTRGRPRKLYKLTVSGIEYFSSLPGAPMGTPHSSIGKWGTRGWMIMEPHNPRSSISSLVENTLTRDCRFKSSSSDQIEQSSFNANAMYEASSGSSGNSFSASEKSDPKRDRGTVFTNRESRIKITSPMKPNLEQISLLCSRCARVDNSRRVQVPGRRWVSLSWNPA